MSMEFNKLLPIYKVQALSDYHQRKLYEYCLKSENRCIYVAGKQYVTDLTVIKNPVLMTALSQAILQRKRKQLILLSIALSSCSENSYSMNMGN